MHDLLTSIPTRSRRLTCMCTVHPRSLFDCRPPSHKDVSHKDADKENQQATADNSATGGSGKAGSGAQGGAGGNRSAGGSPSARTWPVRRSLSARAICTIKGVPEPWGLLCPSLNVLSGIYIPARMEPPPPPS